MTTPVVRTVRNSLQLATLAEVPEDTLAHVPADANHYAVVQQLVSAGLMTEAVRFVAFALPKREAVWWAWVIAKRASGATPAPVIRDVLEATERWIAQPTDANSWVAWEKAQLADIGTPAGCAGAAAFMSGTSIAPPHVAPVPPNELDSPKLIAGTVLMAVLSTEPEKATEKFVAAIQQGLDVIAKIKLWPGDAVPLQPPQPTPA